MEIEQRVWGFTEQGEAVILYTMRNAAGATVELTNIGAAIVGVTVPDRNGKLDDVVLGYRDWKSYFGCGAAMGKSVGRFANRIGRGLFTLDGVQYRLACNNGPNHLHGGVDNFANRVWTSRVETNRVVFDLESADGDQGYPSDLSVEAVYDWDDDCSLEITYSAVTRGRTIVNLTNHAYFNLSGEASGSVLDHRLQLNCSRYLASDTTQIPTGELCDVAGTPMDFRHGRRLGEDIGSDFAHLREYKGYDHCFAVDGWQKNRLAEVGVLSDPRSGRRMEILSSQPGIQVYTGNYLAGTAPGRSGRCYADYDGVALECQNWPDAPNKPGFPSPVLSAGERYVQKIVYRFSAER